MDRFKFRAWIGKERALIGYGARYLYFNAIGGISDSFLKKEGFDEVEQCTGLKDKNDKLIYENDLIKCPNGIYRIAVDDFGLWTAIYENNPLKDVVEWSDIVKNYAFNQENVEIEVIGNIHTNPDLLGEE